jgi:prepilin-type N-terminal cleavage/methylation domain-containing protein
MQSDRPKKPARHLPSRGYTLIEMVVVMAVFALMLAVAVPNMTRGNSWRRVEGAGRDLAARMQMVRQMAVLKRMPYRMTLNREAQTYAFERQEPDSTWVAEPAHPYPLEGIHRVTSRIGGSASADQIYFETRGTVRTEDAPAEIDVTNENGDRAAVVLVRTGRVTTRMTRGGS